MRADRIWAGLRSGLLGLRTVLLLAIGVVYLGYVLAEWPWTRGASRDLVAFALGPLQVIGAGIVANIPSLIFLTVLFFVVRLALRLFRLFFEAVGPRHRHRSPASTATGRSPRTRSSASPSSRSPSSWPTPTFPDPTPTRSRAFRFSSGSSSRWDPRRRSPTSSPATC